MRQPIHAVVMLFLVLAILCLIVITLSRLVAPPDELQTLGFGSCEGEPCYRGIVPGITRWSDAKARFATDTNLSVDSSGVEIIASDVRTRLLSDLSRDRVTSVEGIIAVPAGAIIAHYGLPCRVRLEFYGNDDWAMQMQYPSLTVIISLLASHRVGARSHAVFITLGADHYLMGTQLKARNECGGTLNWKGLTTIKRYVQN